ncbi:MAG: flagellar hook-basal body complex protein [Rariglobus sp.]
MSLIGTLTSGVSAMRSFTKGLEVIGNNIANVNTVGYKSASTNFADSFSNTLRGSSPSSGATPNMSSTQVGTGVSISSITSNFTQGGLSTTGVTTDLGISGSGFFRVTNPIDGQEYATRSGNFRFDDQGYLVTADGYRVQGETSSGGIGDIQLGTPPSGAKLDAYTISAQGNIVERYSDGSSATTNRLLLQNYNDTSALQKMGNNYYTGFEAAGPVGGAALSVANNGAGANGLGKIESGALELSNVDLTEQFANMITTQRSFQASSRLVTVSDSILEDIVNLKRS